MATQKHRSKGTGSVRARGKDRWQVAYDLPVREGQPRRQRFETVKGTKKQAEARLRAILEGLANDKHVEKSSATVSGFVHEWMETQAKPNVTPRTFEGYQGDVRRYLDPLLGTIRLQSLTAEDIDGMFTAMRAKGLSENTLVHAYVLLNQALKFAVKRRRIVSNPCDLVDKPTIRKVEQHILAFDSTSRFFEAIAESPHADAFRFIFYTGVRRSEALGLRWQSVDLEAGHVAITAGLHRLTGQGLVLLPPKTEQSRRRIHIPASLVEILRDVKGRQLETSALSGVPWSTDWFVFAHEDGKPLSPDAVGHDFTARMRTAGIEGIHLHSMRHGLASHLLAEGKSPKLVQEVLGHSLASTTLNLYGHVIPGDHAKALADFAERFAAP